jgi:LCP family protein required for cell wall assembly
MLRLSGRFLVGVLLVIAGLVPVYAFTPVGGLARQLIAPGAGANGRAFLAPVARGTPVHPQKNGGANAGSVVVTEVPAPDMTPAAVPTASSGDSRFAVLLMGYGGGGHDGAYLSDSMMVVVVDPAHTTLTLLSVPRDSWVPMTFDGKTMIYNKVNTAYAFANDPTMYPDRLSRYDGEHGPGTFATDTVSRLLGIPIQYYLGLDFQGFRQMIDAVGGVDVDVPASFAAQYPANDDPSVDASWTTVRFTQGHEHMNGERAIEFARARETLDNPDEGTDFARSRRQRLIMQAFKTRLFEPGGLIHLPQLLGIANQHVDTNYSIPDTAKLAQLVLGWRNVTIYQTALTTANYLEDATGPDGAYITVPETSDHSWAQIRAFSRQLWKDPAIGVAMAKTTITVENDSGVSGLAGRVSTALLGMGYQVADPVTGSYRAHSQVLDRTDGASKPLVAQLGKDLGLSAPDVANPPADGASQLVLELGADAANLVVPDPTDSQAPRSTIGVLKFGVWPYTAAAAPPTMVVETTPRAIASIAQTPSVFHAALTPTATLAATTTPSAALVVVPSLIGLAESDAQRLIANAGLQTSYVNYQTSSDVADHRYFLSIAPNHVLSQSPAPGASVPRGTKVFLAVRKD